MNGRPTAINVDERSWPISGKYDELTQHALRTHCNSLDHIAPLADPRVEQHGERSLFLRTEHPRRRRDLLQRRER